MNKKSLILSIILVLIVLISISAVSSANHTNTVSNNDATTHSEITVNTTDTNDQIQEKINILKDGDFIICK